MTLDYAYDGFGNITDRRLTAMTNYTVGTNPLELFGGRNYTPGVAPVTDNQIHEAGFLYDGNGNLISDGVKDFIYDELNQQIEVRAVTTSCAAAGEGSGSFESSANAGEEAIPHGTLCYGRGTLVEKNGYDGGGMRVVRETYDPVTSFPKRTIYARLGGSVVKEYTQEYRGPISPAPELSHEKAYIYGPLGLLATEELCLFNCKSDESAGLNVTRYYEYDHLGTIRAITNASGNLESTFDYEPFGLELKGTTASWTTDISSNTHRFTGHERDEEAGEDYMKARMYVLSTARFPQIDPKFGGAGDPQNWNPYIYVLNSPVGASDPTGTLPIPYGDKFAGREMTATLGPGEGASGLNESTTTVLTINVFILVPGSAFDITLQWTNSRGQTGEYTASGTDLQKLADQINHDLHGAVNVNISGSGTNENIKASLASQNTATILIGHSIEMQGSERANAILTDNGYIDKSGFHEFYSPKGSGPIDTNNSFIGIFACDSAYVDLPFRSYNLGGTTLMTLDSGGDRYTDFGAMSQAVAGTIGGLSRGGSVNEAGIDRSLAAYLPKTSDPAWTRKPGFDPTYAHQNGDHVVTRQIPQVGIAELLGSQRTW